MTEYQEPMAPVPYRIFRRKQETNDVFTFELVPSKGTETIGFAPGQFNMLYAFGLGEVPISVSGDPEDQGKLVHTIRVVGAVTKGLAALKRDESIGVRGPFGSDWPLKQAVGHDVIVVAGGLGLAPLRPALYALLSHPERYGKLTLLYGARTEEDLLFTKEWGKWKNSGKIAVEVSLGQASRKWRGTVGHVTALLPRISIQPEKTIAFVCGPETMMRFVAIELEKRGVNRDRIFISMERNMKCAVGFCGHCQFGPHFVCADGPIFPYGRMEPLLRIREL